MSCKIKMGVTHFDEGCYLFMKEGVTTTMKRRKGLGATVPLMVYCPLLLYILDMLLFSLDILSSFHPLPCESTMVVA
jgi:hypothetical protein